jgi:hypothetical protein
VVHIVTYDLHNAGRDYAKIENVLKQEDYWAHPQGSVWFIDTLLPPSDLVDRLRAVGDANDEYFVAQMRQSWSSFNMNTDVVTWLKKSPQRRW